MSASDPGLLPAVQFGRYQIERELGRGGMGTVYLARDMQLDRLVALKVPSFNNDDQESVTRFYREARAMATVQHANLCPVFDVGQIDGQHFLTMAYIDGHSLAEHLRGNGAGPPRVAAEWLRKIALAVQKAHEAGVVHRDLKPANIMLNRDGEPIIMDFGLARRAKPGETDLTHKGTILGTPAYMSPEQIESRNHEIGPATDIWALGVILYQLLCGQRPFEGSVASVLVQIVDRQPPPPSQYSPQVPPQLDAVCLKALQKQPAERYASARELADDLERFLSPAATGSASTSLENLSLVEHTVTYARKPSAPARNEAAGGSRRREAERRQVTVAVFNFDAAGLTADGDAETHREFVTAFTAFVRERIVQSGGSVMPSLGQEVLACFGYPHAYEDSSRRAVHAALQVLHDAGRSPPATLPPASAMYAVVHTGEAIAELLGDTEQSVSLVGDARNTAVRLDAVAEPGAVLISGATQQRVALFFEAESIGVQRVRGIAQPLELFRVVREASSRNKIELVDPGNLSPLIGRDTELGILKDRWEQMLDGLGQIVLLIGDAGLGKSRLIRELREHIRQPTGHTEPAVIEFRCSQYHSNAGFFPAVEFLSRLLEFEPRTPEERLRAIERFLRHLGLDSPTHVVLMAQLLSVPAEGYPPLDVTPQRQKELTAELLRRWLMETSNRRPTLFVVEDLHWIDPTTLDLIAAHVEGFEAGRLLTILTFRPEFQTPWRSFSHQTQIALNRLTKRQIGDLLKRRMKRRDVPDVVVAQVADRTDGVPLFIEEFANLIAESGALDASASDTSITTNVLASIPATLQDLLGARLDRMASNPDVVQLAAAIGREFSYRLLASACELPETVLQAELQKLVRAEMLFQKGIVPEAHFIFKHALIQDSAYRSLLKKKRQHFHRRIAETLETQFAEIAATQPDLVAQHFTEAEAAERAVPYWRQAGDRARQLSANHEAISHYGRGLELVATLPPSPERDGSELSMTVPMGVAMLAAKGYANPEAGPVFDRARELGERVAQPPLLFYILWGSWAWRLVRSDLDHCRDLGQRILSLAASLPDPSWTCEAHFVPAVNNFYAGDFAASRQHAAESLRHIDPDQCAAHAHGTGQDVRAGSYSYYALSSWALGHVDDALRRAREGVAVSRSLRHPMSLSFALAHAAWMLSNARLWSEALPLAEEAERLATEQGLPLWQGMAKAEQGACLIQLGRRDEGLPLLRAGYEAFAGTGARNVPPMWLTNLAEGHLAAGQLGEAERWLERSLQHARDHGNEFYLAETLRVQGDLELARGAPSAADAETCYERAIADARSRQAKSWELRATLSLARLWRSLGRGVEARARLQAIYDEFTEGHATPDLMDARRWLDEV